LCMFYCSFTIRWTTHTQY
jgi:hypothetical protein